MFEYGAGTEILLPFVLSASSLFNFNDVTRANFASFFFVCARLVSKYFVSARKSLLSNSAL